MMRMNGVIMESWRNAEFHNIRDHLDAIWSSFLLEN